MKVVNNIISGPGLEVTIEHQPYVSMSNMSAGLVRYNGNSSHWEVFDGNSWVVMSQTVILRLDNETRELLAWAKNKKEQEDNITRLAEKNPMVKDLVQQIKEKENQLLMVQNIIQ